mmetsp:Transcript_28170/g.97005  ORF Transcript_28170/g.97005 Transcript_28170/m.97005 type:complete len:224 (+) Transcript_28170:776-1447(+)
MGPTTTPVARKRGRLRSWTRSTARTTPRTPTTFRVGCCARAATRRRAALLRPRRGARRRPRPTLDCRDRRPDRTVRRPAGAAASRRLRLSKCSRSSRTSSPSSASATRRKRPAAGPRRAKLRRRSRTSTPPRWRGASRRSGPPSRHWRPSSRASPATAPSSSRSRPATWTRRYRTLASTARSAGAPNSSSASTDPRPTSDAFLYARSCDAAVTRAPPLSNRPH